MMDSLTFGKWKEDKQPPECHGVFFPEMESLELAFWSKQDAEKKKWKESFQKVKIQGCVEVVGYIKCKEAANWEVLPEGVRLEAQTGFCWFCENPQKLLVPFEMRGYQGVYNLEKKIYEAAIRGLTLIKSRLLVRFPASGSTRSFFLRNQDLFLHKSLKRNHLWPKNHQILLWPLLVQEHSCVVFVTFLYGLLCFYCFVIF
ncbi:hypothetical protein Pint_22531 [Pistacia integerrima]|uniref:Uncharacterized protein n=1 Tax=Pistacia integerrima TaxID=434235 RepID=A0ACC0YI35_9ROSI|nr:hypothetical protein Pint_22531 [Pistacia integerrima]